MKTLVQDRLQPMGKVGLRVIDTRKLFALGQKYGIYFGHETFDEYLAENGNSTFRILSVKLAEELGGHLAGLLIDQCAKKQFKENALWKFLKKQFKIDLRIPLFTGMFTNGMIVRDNLVVNTGLKAYADRIGGTNGQGAMTALAIGTSGTTPGAGDTALGAEITTGGGARAAATITNITTSTTGDTEQWTHTWTFTLSFSIQEEGIFDNNSSGGTLLAHNTFSTVSVVNGDSFQVTHTIQS